MNYIIKSLLFLFLTITVLIGQVHVAGTRRPVVIQDSERHELVSACVDDTFKVHVYYPRGYADMTDPIPVVFLLDAEYSFGAVAYTIRRLIKDNLIPPVLLVGVAYEVPYDEYYRRRERDFTPTLAHLDDFPRAGHAQSFGRFLHQEPKLSEKGPT